MSYPERAECADLIEHVLSLVGEAEDVDCQAVARGDVQRFLDETRQPVDYEPLYARRQIAPGGQAVYKQFSDEGGFLDNAAQLLDTGYNPLQRGDGDVWDALRGRWTFNDTQNAVLYLFGDRYDVYQAAANVLRKLQADNKYTVDVADSSMKTYSTQALATMARLEASYRSQARVGFVEFSRSDIGGGW